MITEACPNCETSYAVVRFREQTIEFVRPSLYHKQVYEKTGRYIKCALVNTINNEKVNKDDIKWLDKKIEPGHRVQWYSTIEDLLNE